MYAVLALAVVAISEASIGIFVKLVGDQIPILTLNFYRVCFAAVFILLAVLVTKPQALRFPKNNLRDILIIGALIALQISLYNTAMILAPVANVVIFWSIAPFFVFIFSTLFLGERPHWSYLLIFLAAFVGVAIAEPISFNADMWSGVQLGNLLALITGVVYAGLVTYMRHEGTTESNVDVFWFMVAASMYLFPALLFFGWGDIFATSVYTAFGYSVPVLLWAIGLGVISTGLAFFGMSIVLKRFSANIYSLIDIITSPIIAAFLAFLVFSEMPAMETIIGGAILVVAGMTLTFLRHRMDVKSVPTKSSIR